MGGEPMMETRMAANQLVIVFVTLALAAAFLYIWKRRDAGEVPQED